LAVLAAEAQQAADGAALVGLGEEDPVLPDNGGGVADLGELHLPADVVFGAPFQGQVRLRTMPLASCAAPRRPVVGPGGGTAQKREEDQQAARAEGSGHGRSPWVGRRAGHRQKAGNRISCQVSAAQAIFCRKDSVIVKLL